MGEFKTVVLSDRSHHNVTVVTYQQDKTLMNTVDQARDTDRRHSNDNNVYYFYGNPHWKGVYLAG